VFAPRFPFEWQTRRVDVVAEDRDRSSIGAERGDALLDGIGERDENRIDERVRVRRGGVGQGGFARIADQEE
jgi:hypothetical protein